MASRGVSVRSSVTASSWDRRGLVTLVNPIYQNARDWVGNPVSNGSLDKPASIRVGWANALSAHFACQIV